eukprot:TRINITY_DN84737_c0_g1_i1.p1 TRINITY_DN84737_c0_g1~~TRINITY_DN84737_c0_g1_i1.p1  ORF type:complete len:362 (+),score=80.00 TRINITY_DN84737_c0_g1_i1:54-1139(+)
MAFKDALRRLSSGTSLIDSSIYSLAVALAAILGLHWVRDARKSERGLFAAPLYVGSMAVRLFADASCRWFAPSSGLCSDAADLAEEEESGFGIRPVRLDLRRADEELRSLARAALMDTASPMFCVEHFGFEQLLADTVIFMRAHEKLDGKPLTESCETYVLRAQDETDGREYFCDDILLKEFHREIRTLARRLLGILLGEAALQELEATGQYVDGKLSLRFYPGGDQCMRLNAHVDANLFTLLWAGGPGYEALDPGSQALQKESIMQDVLQVGMPCFGEGPAVDLSADEFYAPVCIGGMQDPPRLLLGLGLAWWRSPLVQRYFPEPERVLCPLLHRVRLEGREPRFSIPYLVDVHSAPPPP